MASIVYETEICVGEQRRTKNKDVPNDLQGRLTLGMPRSQGDFYHALFVW